MEVWWLTPRPAALPAGMTRYLLYKMLGRPRSRSERVRKISPPPGFNPRTVQLVASRNTDWAIAAQVNNHSPYKLVIHVLPLDSRGQSLSTEATEVSRYAVSPVRRRQSFRRLWDEFSKTWATWPPAATPRTEFDLGKDLGCWQNEFKYPHLLQPGVHVCTWLWQCLCFSTNSSTSTRQFSGAGNVRFRVTQKIC